MNINRTNDRVFKTIFGNAAHKNITLSLINAIFEFEGTEQIADIEFLDRQFDPQYDRAKASILDIRGKTKEGIKLNIEMQVVNEKNFEKRTMYYWSKLYCDDLQKGQDYNDLTRTVAINILAFALLPCEAYHSMYGVYNVKTMHKLTEDMEIHIVEIPKWQMNSNKEMKRLDKWLAYFSNRVSKEEMEAISMSEPAIQEAINAESVFKQDERARYAYEQREKEIRDYRSAMNTARREGLEEGLERGLERGIEKTAINLLRLGAELEVIEMATGLSKERLEKMKSTLLS